MLYIGIGLIAIILFPALRSFLLLCGVFGAIILAGVIVYMKLFPNQDPCSSFDKTVSQYAYWSNVAVNVEASRPFMSNAVEQIEVCENHLASTYRQDLAAMPPQQRAEFNVTRANVLRKVISSYPRLYRMKENQIIRDIKKEERNKK